MVEYRGCQNHKITQAPLTLEMAMREVKTTVPRGKISKTKTLAWWKEERIFSGKSYSKWANVWNVRSHLQEGDDLLQCKMGINKFYLYGIAIL